MTKNRNTIATMASFAALAAYANAPAAAGSPPASTPPATEKAKRKPPSKPNIQIVGVGVKIEGLSKPSNRGGKSQFPFDKLEPGFSFGLIGRDAKSMSSVISSQNRKHVETKRDANGAIIYKTTETKHPETGATITVPTTEPETVQKKFFYAVDVDPKKDEAGATVRVVREY